MNRHVHTQRYHTRARNFSYRNCSGLQKLITVTLGGIPQPNWTKHGENLADEFLDPQETQKYGNCGKDKDRNFPWFQWEKKNQKSKHIIRQKCFARANFRGVIAKPKSGKQKSRRDSQKRNAKSCVLMAARKDFFPHFARYSIAYICSIISEILECSRWLWIRMPRCFFTNC
jgi:hypothetical protein